jgi:hypothetical protein
VREHVDAAEARLGLGDRALDARLIGDVAREREPAFGRVRRAQVERDDARALAGEAAGGRAPDPARGAGDDRDLAVQTASLTRYDYPPFDRYGE